MKSYLRLLFFSALAAGSMLAQAPSEVQFTQCTEYVGTGPIPIANARPFVPRTFTIFEAPTGFATIVVRATKCAGISVDGSAPEPGALSQIGVIVAAPDGTGDINNYTAVYVTTNKRLAQRLERNGLPVTVDEQLTYEVTPNPLVTAGKLYVSVTPEGFPPYFFSGNVTEPAANTAIPFLANWWYESKKGRLKMSTFIPAIAFGQSAVTVYSSKTSPLGLLIGGNQFSNFNGFNVRGVFASGVMSVVVR